MNLVNNKNEKVYWYDKSKQDHRGESLNEDQKIAFGWLIKILKKKPENLTDHERDAQKIYTNVIIF